VCVMGERTQVCDDSRGETAEVSIQVLLATGVLNLQARERAQVAEAGRLEGDPHDDRERPDSIEFHRDRGGERSEVRRESPLIYEDKQRLCESRVPGRGPLGWEPAREEGHVDRLLDLVQVYRRTHVEEAVEDDLALHAAAQAGDET